METYQKNFYSTKITDKEIHQGNIYKIKKSIKNGIIGIVVISNDCDLVNNKSNFVYYSPILNIKEVFKTELNPKNLDRLSKIMQQRKSGFFYLLPFPKASTSIGYIVDCSQIKMIDKKSFLTKFPTPYIQIKTPYREKLSWKFSDLFGRIPIDFPEQPIITKWLKDNFTK